MDNVAVVHLLPDPQPPELAGLLLIKELCYLADLESYKRLSGSGAAFMTKTRNAAVRCGEQLLMLGMPEAVGAYRELFGLPFAGGSPSAEVFAEYYPVDRRVISEMSSELAKWMER